MVYVFSISGVRACLHKVHTVAFAFRYSHIFHSRVGNFETQSYTSINSNLTQDDFYFNPAQ